MPVEFSYQCGFWEANPKRWQYCLDQAAKEMLAAGWDKYARKFWTVQHKKAKKLWVSLDKF